MLKLPLCASFALLSFSQCLFAGNFTVDPSQSEFLVDVRATGHSFEVLLNEYSADLEIGQGSELQSATFSFAVEDLDSDKKKRDREMLEWLESETIPEISFVLEKVEENDGQQVGVGQLTLHGVTKTVKVPFTIETSGAQTTVSGNANIDYTEYDLEVITMFFMKVKPELEISFRLVGSLED